MVSNFALLITRKRNVMEKIKALLAVAMFIAFVLFTSYENEPRKGLPAKKNTYTEKKTEIPYDTLVQR
jgi:hypothetical protein